MDRRIKDRGKISRGDGSWTNALNGEPRSGQDRRKHDLLAEARRLFLPEPMWSSEMRICAILITMRERRK